MPGMEHGHFGCSGRLRSDDLRLMRTARTTGSSTLRGTPRRIRTLTNRGPWPRALSVMLWAHIKSSYKTLTGAGTSKLELICHSLMVDQVGIEPTSRGGLCPALHSATDPY